MTEEDVKKVCKYQNCSGCGGDEPCNKFFENLEKMSDEELIAIGFVSEEELRGGKNEQVN